MTKAAAAAKRSMKQPAGRDGQATMREFSADEFDADTQEDRSVPMLAEKRRQFLAQLDAKSSDFPSEE